MSEVVRTTVNFDKIEIDISNKTIFKFMGVTVYEVEAPSFAENIDENILSQFSDDVHTVTFGEVDFCIVV
jgi:hypothetical protein